MQVYAVSKERDALRKGAEKLADYGALIKEKDDIIKQVHRGRATEPCDFHGRTGTPVAGRYAPRTSFVCKRHRSGWDRLDV